MNFLRPFALLVLLSVCASNASSQDIIKVMSYNVLNFPFGDMADRQDTLALILEELQPDLLLLQELKTEAGLNQIATESCSGLDGDYVASTWEPLQSNPTSSWPLQQGLVYNKEVLGMLEESVILTPYRDVNAFRMFVKDEATTGGDTTYFNVFVTHLKSSQGSDNEALRNDMAVAFVAALEDFDPGVPAIIAGDFNIYTSDEPAYQTLLDPLNPVVFLDPIDAPGAWTESSFGMPEVLTQSTRSSQIYGDGAGGGLDDRFDFALLSTHFFDMASPLQFVEGSYTAYGNTGLCYNGSLIACEEDDDVPPEVTWALYHMSDHLPILFNLETSSPLSIAANGEGMSVFPALVYRSGHLQISLKGSSWPGSLRIVQSDGTLVGESSGVFNNGDRLKDLPASGMLLFQWTREDGRQHVDRLPVLD